MNAILPKIGASVIEGRIFVHPVPEINHARITKARQEGRKAFYAEIPECENTFLSSGDEYIANALLKTLE